MGHIVYAQGNHVLQRHPRPGTPAGGKVIGGDPVVRGIALGGGGWNQFFHHRARIARAGADLQSVGAQRGDDRGHGGAEVVAVEHGSATLKDAINEALRDWVTNVGHTHYVLGTVTGPHPFPEMVRDFHKIIGEEARQQVLDLTGRLPDAVVACVGGGSNAMGIFHRFVEDEGVRLVGVEAGGEGIEGGRHAARFATAEPGVLHGAMSYLMQDDEGHTLETHSISAGLDYPSVGPEHAYLRDTGRAEYRYATDEQAMEAFLLMCRTEGIIPALESSHALAGAIEVGRELGPEAVVLVNLSGRGDKDMHTAARWFGLVDDEAEGTPSDGAVVAGGAESVADVDGEGGVQA